jgi:hypothetical protein
MTQTILVVFGTRPEAIKMFPVVHALAADPRFRVVTCVSAQHRGMLDQVLAIAGIVPDHDLDLMKPDQTLDALTAALLTGLGGRAGSLLSQGARCPCRGRATQPQYLSSLARGGEPQDHWHDRCAALRADGDIGDCASGGERCGGHDPRDRQHGH